MTNREKRENRWGILFSPPCILGFLIFALLPMAVSLGLSFTNFNFTTGGQFIGISNYKNLFSGSDPYFYKSLLVTVIYVALSVPTAIIFSFFISSNTSEHPEVSETTPSKFSKSGSLAAASFVPKI